MLPRCQSLFGCVVAYVFAFHGGPLAPSLLLCGLDHVWQLLCIRTPAVLYCCVDDPMIDHRATCIHACTCTHIPPSPSYHLGRQNRGPHIYIHMIYVYIYVYLYLYIYICPGSQLPLFPLPHGNGPSVDASPPLWDVVWIEEVPIGSTA